MSQILLHHHLGLGDHIICNGLVRTFLENYERVFLFAKEHNAKSVSRMYIDNPRLVVLPMPDFGSDGWYGESSYTQDYSTQSGLPLLQITVKDLKENENFDKSFYESVGISHNHRWEKFHLNRDLESEKSAFEKMVGDANTPYIFVHDDIKRGFELIPFNQHGHRVIKNDTSVDFFSIISVLEKAEEIHCMESSVSCLIEQLETIDEKKLFYYPKIRNSIFCYQATRRKSWKIVD